MCKGLSHRRHTQRMCHVSYHVASDLHLGQYRGPNETSTHASDFYGSSRSVVARLHHFAHYWRNLPPNLPRQIPQHLGNDSPVRWMDMSGITMDPDLPCHQRPEPNIVSIRSVSALSLHLASRPRDHRYRLSMGVSTQSPCTLRGSLETCCPSLVRVHDTHCWHCRKACRTSFG